MECRTAKERKGGNINQIIEERLVEWTSVNLKNEGPLGPKHK